MSLPALATYEPPRRHPRVRIDKTALLEGHAGPSRVTLGDISSGGLFVASHDLPEVGSLVTIHFRLISQLDCHAVGRVVWTGTRGEQTGFGVEFDATSKQMTSFTTSLTKMAPKLRPIYLAGVGAPTITVE